MHSPEDDEALDRARDERFRKELRARLPEPLRFVADLPDLDALDATENDRVRVSQELGNRAIDQRL